jgi:hypothetical protein
MEKESPKKSTKKKAEKQSQREVAPKTQLPETQQPSQASKGRFDVKIRGVERERSSVEAQRAEAGNKSNTERQDSPSLEVAQQQGIVGEPARPYMEGAKSKLTPEQLECEAELYADIATLNSLISNYDKGNLDVSTYKRQVQSLITDIMTEKIKLERTGITMEQFLEGERILERYALACEKFKLLDSNATLESFVESLAVSKADVATSTAEIVTNLITLSDYAKLGGDMAKVESLLPHLDQIISLLEKFPTTRKDYWGLKILRDWRDKLSMLSYDSVLSNDEAKRLELDIVRLFSDFRRRLREI